MTCRSCKYLRIAPDASGRIVARKGKAYACTVDVPAPPVPASIAVSQSWRWPPSRNYMGPEDGAGCPFHENRAPTGTGAA